MTPSARIQAAIDILEGLDATAMPADRFIRDFFRTRRYAGSKDRASVAERVFDMFRHRASYAWRLQSDAPRALAIASVLAEAGDVDALFGGSGYGPAPLSDDERAAIAAPQRLDPPRWVTCEYPAFLDAELERSLGPSLVPEMRAMQRRASVDLRVNTLKAAREDVRAKLVQDGFDVRSTPYSPWGLRIPAQAGLVVLQKHPLFEQGLFEFQDEASQIASLLADARSGMRVLDLAAGAGGKALALAAAMGNRGEIIASDIHPQRLAQIEARAARAGVTIIRTTPEVPVRDSFDLVFVDAPCSGSGTWRRQPEQKWRLTQARLDELTALQSRLLDLGAARTTARLVYATCSLLACENDDRIAGFLARHPTFRPAPALASWHQAAAEPPPPGLGEFFRASPATTGTDGFFAAIVVHKDAP